jgi:dihydroxy-acid dehydratase
VTKAELTRRRRAWKQPKARYTKGVLAKYAKVVSGADTGAVTD